MGATLTHHSTGVWCAFDPAGHQLGTVFRIDGHRPSWTARSDTGRTPPYALPRRLDALRWLEQQHRAPITPLPPPSDVVLAGIRHHAGAGRPDVAAILATGAVMQLVEASLAERGTTSVPNVWAVVERIGTWVRAVSEEPADVQRQANAVVHDEEADLPAAQQPRGAALHSQRVQTLPARPPLSDPRRPGDRHVARNATYRDELGPRHRDLAHR